MKERPILFSGPMVRAILAGTKTQTRRVVKPAYVNDNGYSLREVVHGVAARKLTGPNDRAYVGFGHPSSSSLAYFGCPYGQPGDRLWVRETCFAKALSDDESLHYDGPGGASDTCERVQYGLEGVYYLADSEFTPIQNTRKASDAWSVMHGYRGKNGATVPAIHMPRWASRITLEITGVRVERLNEISGPDAAAEGIQFRKLGHGVPLQGNIWRKNIDGFRDLWESINGAGSWDANPWVWVVEFKVV